MKVLIDVDIQNDFCPKGALAVPNGDEVVPFANSIKSNYDIVIATQDWHPWDAIPDLSHVSFASSHPGKNLFDLIEVNGQVQVLWPDHCVQGTNGANFHPDLDLQGITVFRKGTDRTIDSYSGFYDNGRKKSTGLTSYLNRLRSIITTPMKIDVIGLATDYCVKATAIDARLDGFDVSVLLQGCRGVNMQPTDCEKAIEEMLSKGVTVVV